MLEVVLHPGERRREALLLYYLPAASYSAMFVTEVLRFPDVASR